MDAPARGVSAGKDVALYKIDHQGDVHPVSDRHEWDRWMLEHKGELRGLIQSGPMAIGVRFLGKEKGMDDQFRPLVWQAAFLIKEQSIATLHAPTFDAAIEKVVRGLTRAQEHAPWRIRLRAKFLAWKVQRRKKKLKQWMLDSLK
jgi:hypothetical protein